MLEENYFVRFHSGRYQFKVPFAIYSDFEVILNEEETNTDSAMKQINCHAPS